MERLFNTGTLLPFQSALLSDIFEGVRLAKESM
jgi:hypothetical protein